MQRWYWAGAGVFVMVMAVRGGDPAARAEPGDEGGAETIQAEPQQHVVRSCCYDFYDRFGAASVQRCAMPVPLAVGAPCRCDIHGYDGSERSYNGTACAP